MAVRNFGRARAAIDRPPIWAMPTSSMFQMNLILSLHIKFSSTGRCLWKKAVPQLLDLR